MDAATQIFYSFGLAFGCLIALSSYNPIRNNFVQEALIVTVADFFTSIFTACVVFSILGKHLVTNMIFLLSHVKTMRRVCMCVCVCERKREMRCEFIKRIEKLCL